VRQAALAVEVDLGLFIFCNIIITVGAFTVALIENGASWMKNDREIEQTPIVCSIE
jgi:hypothetical protein